MMDYLRGGADVLVCTSIIESGIDIPQANTLIVEHADTLRARPALPDPRARRAQPRARLRLPAVRLGGGADAGGGAAAGGAVGLHRARRGLQDRDARPRDPRRRQPARRRAVRARRGARLRAVHADARRGGARGGARGARARRCPSRCAWTSTSTPTCRPTTSPTSRPRSRCTAASPGRSRSPTWSGCARSSRIASARCPSRVENLLALQRARIKFGQAGARTVSFRGERLAVVPIELDSARAERLREELPERAV